MRQRLSRHVEQKDGAPRRAWIGASILVLVLLAPVGARADSGTADALFREGRKAADAGDHATAAARFAESQRLDPASGTLLNLAIAEEKLQRFASALDHAAAAVDGLPKGDGRLALAKALRARLEARVPRVRIRLASDAPAGTIVQRDGVELGTAALGLELPVDPGSHRVVVRCEGHDDGVFSFVAKEGDHSSLDVSPGPATPTSPPPIDKQLVDHAPSPPPQAPSAERMAPPPTTGPSTSRAGIALTALGGVGLVASGVLGGLVLGKKAVVEDHCPAKRCDAEGLAAGDAGRSLSLASTIAFGIGAASAGVGVYLLVRRPATDGANVGLSVAPGRLGLGGTF
jgi:hypothetical protein